MHYRSEPQPESVPRAAPRLQMTQSFLQQQQVKGEYSPSDEPGPGAQEQADYQVLVRGGHEGEMRRSGSGEQIYQGQA